MGEHCMFRDTYGWSMESDGRKVLLCDLIAMRVCKSTLEACMRDEVTT